MKINKKLLPMEDLLNYANDFSGYSGTGGAGAWNDLHQAKQFTLKKGKYLLITKIGASGQTGIFTVRIMKNGNEIPYSRSTMPLTNNLTSSNVDTVVFNNDEDGTYNFVTQAYSSVPYSLASIKYNFIRIGDV